MFRKVWTSKVLQKRNRSQPTLKKKPKRYTLHMKLPLPLAVKLKRDARASGQTLAAHVRMLLDLAQVN